MTQNELLRISGRLCERGFLRCTGIEAGTPKYEITFDGEIELIRFAAGS